MCSCHLSHAIPFMSTYWNLLAATCFQVASVGTLPLCACTFLECSQSCRISSTPNTPGFLCIFIVTLEPCRNICRNDEMNFPPFCLGLSAWALSHEGPCVNSQLYLSLSPFLCDRSDWVSGAGCKMDWTLSFAFVHLWTLESTHTTLLFCPQFSIWLLQMHAEAGGVGTGDASQTHPSQLCNFVVGFSVEIQSMTYQKSWQNLRHLIWWYFELYILEYIYNISIFLNVFKRKIFEHWSVNSCGFVVHILSTMLRSMETSSKYQFDRDASLISLELSQIH